MNEISFLNLKKKWYMKTKDHVLNLLSHGFKFDTVARLNESQVRILSEKISKEESKEQVTKKMTTTYEIPAQTAKTTGADIGNVNIKVDPSGIVKVVCFCCTCSLFSSLEIFSDNTLTCASFNLATVSNLNP